MTNPNIGEDGKDTRFGSPGGADPSAAAQASHANPDRNRPYSIRKEKRRLILQDIDPESKTPFRDQVVGKRKLVNGASLLAAVHLDLAANGDSRALEDATDQIDGKLLQPNLNADLATVRAMTEDQLYEVIRGSDSAAGRGIGGDGAAETQGSTATVGADASPARDEPSA